mgnify:FL=1
MDLPDLCPLHAATGLWCPLCGLTRGAFRLVTADPVAALRYNALIVVVPLLVWWAVAGRRRPGAAMGALVVLLVAFTVVRNLPGAAWLRGPG